MDWRGDSKSIYVKQAAAAAEAAVVGGKNEGEKKKIRSNTNQSGEGAAGGGGVGRPGGCSTHFTRARSKAFCETGCGGGWREIKQI